jgi:hypothetical protein
LRRRDTAARRQPAQDEVARVEAGECVGHVRVEVVLAGGGPFDGRSEVEVRQRRPLPLGVRDGADEPADGAREPGDISGAAREAGQRRGVAVRYLDRVTRRRTTAEHTAVGLRAEQRGQGVVVGDGGVAGRQRLPAVAADDPVERPGVGGAAGEPHSRGERVAGVGGDADHVAVLPGEALVLDQRGEDGMSLGVRGEGDAAAAFEIEVANERAQALAPLGALVAGGHDGRDHRFDVLVFFTFAAGLEAGVDTRAVVRAVLPTLEARLGPPVAERESLAAHARGSATVVL